MEWGFNAIKVMLRWAGNECERGLMLRTECELLFGPDLSSLPQKDLTKYIEREIDIASVGRFIFGGRNLPADSLSFLEQYRRIRDWILVPDHPPSFATRLFVLRVLMQSRLFRVRQYLANRGILPDRKEVIALQEETRTLTEVEHFEKVHNGEATEQEERDAWIAIQITLLKCYPSEDTQPSLIDDAELVLRIADCQRLIDCQQNNGNSIREYLAVTNLVQLEWQRYIHFRTVNPRDLMPLAEQTELLFNKVRKIIKGLDAFEDLVAKAKMSQEYSQRQH